MITCSLRLARISLVTLTLGAAFASLAAAQRGPVSADPLAGEVCSQATSVATAQPDLNPVGLTNPEPTPSYTCYSYWGIYDEFWKDGEICRWRNSCEGTQYNGTCPNGYDTHNSEPVLCTKCY